MSAPKGNSNAAKGKIFFDALHKAIKTYENKKRKVKRGEALDRIARKLIEETLDGSGWAMQELINRLDGRAHQSIDVGGTIEHKHAHELNDDQLNRIAAGSSPGTPEPTKGESTLN